MMPHTKKILCLLSIAVFFSGISVGAQTVNVDASKLLARAEISLSPRSGSFVEGSTFQVPILLNTKGKSVNGIEVRVKFDKDKLAIVNPSGGVSIIGIWVEPPGYDNTKGTASYVGVVPNGVTSEAGLIGTITFKAKSPGRAVVSIGSNSKVLLNDGLGTEATLDLGRAEYNLITKAPEGVRIFSQTHPVQSDWYNNDYAVVSWEKEAGVGGFSFMLDDKPGTIPDNTIDTEDTSAVFDKLDDGLWYFHIKAVKGGVWGTIGHFLLRIDTVPPAEFTPTANYLLAATAFVERTLISFSTTDNLSGVSHYEIGVIDKSQPLTKSPVFVQAESPFQVPVSSGGKLQVIVRAIDSAGNIRDKSLDINVPFFVTRFIKDNFAYILLAILLTGFIVLLSHYLFTRHVIRHFRHALKTMKTEENQKTSELRPPDPPSGERRQ
ncbi:hypothetical protein A2755_00120 [Candidatus Wolfebacteria bacterium RIFCSPHIGHO2_01_FULL_48_22]|uniref:Cohesin domain-containing protein n=1 Tax=Candidatus Wolfebacteria bacterium RIFCSPHIGHO2_01_FULL_48_22 TaxID=1802555 RepID=A0A1F8DPF1_9BACT|nr:MAG: hypothetical protein A2755_00120 [Candidatus Wolfebacteria bacterium RIFCSPHIGHO2_01_FULL_48_22]